MTFNTVPRRNLEGEANADSKPGEISPGCIVEVRSPTGPVLALSVRILTRWVYGKIATVCIGAVTRLIPVLSSDIDGARW